MKKSINKILLSAGLILSTAFAGQINWSALEEKDPINFAGFRSTNFEGARAYKNQNQATDIPYVSISLSELSQKLESFQELAQVKADLDVFLEKNPQISPEDEPYYALYYVARILLTQSFEGEQIEDERNFFRYAGFPKTYKPLGVLKALSTLQPHQMSIAQVIRFIREVDKVDEDLLNERRYTRSTSAFFSGSQAVDKALESENDVMLILPGEDVLGFFYLAYVYAQGVHPIPLPFTSEADELHGVALSRFGKFSHDEAHSEADNRHVSLVQFVKNMGNQYAAWLRDNKDKVAILTAEQKKTYALKAMLPHFTAFGKAVSALYQDSLVAILEKGLELYKGEDFNAFAAAAFYRLHETPFRLSKFFGQSKNLSDLIKINEAMSDTIVKAGEVPQAELSEEAKASAILSIFNTSIKDGTTAYDDETLYKIAVTQPLNRFLKNSYLPYLAPLPDHAKIDPNDVSDYCVERNKFFIDVIIEMIDGKTHTYRESTAYARTLNFKHDADILRRAAPVLKELNQYELPMTEEFITDQQVIQHEEALEKGLNHLLNLWGQMAMYVASQKESFMDLSIADRFEQGYMKALGELKSTMPLELQANTENFLKEAGQKGL